MFRAMRRKKQELSKEECFEVLKSEKRAVLSVSGENGYPYAVPINFYFDEADGKIYFHCARSGQKNDALKSNNKVCFTVWTKGKQKSDWSYYVKSVIVFGSAEFIEDEKTKYEKIKKFGMKYYPSEQEVEDEIKKDFKAAQVVAINIDHMTGKLVHEK